MEGYLLYAVYVPPNNYYYNCAFFLPVKTSCILVKTKHQRKEKQTILIVLLQSRLVTRLPYFGQRNCRMESMKDAEWQSDTLHYCPRQEAVEFELYWVRLNFLSFERVDDPHGDVANEEEGDHLPAWLGPVVFWQVDAATRHVCYEKELENHLEGMKNSLKTTMIIKDLI